MKKTTCIALFLLAWMSATVALAEIPDIMQFQGYLADDEGRTLSGVYNITLSIYTSAEGDEQIWTDTKTVIVDLGFFAVILGGEENPLDANVFSGAQLYLGVQIEDDEELRPRQPIGSVPHSLRSGFAEDADHAGEADRAELADTADSVSWRGITEMPEGFADDIDNVLSDAEVLGIIAELGYLTADVLVDYVTLVYLTENYYDITDVDDLLDKYHTKSEVAGILEDFARWDDLADVAGSGLYSDLSGLPNLGNFILRGDLAAVATSGQYTDLTGLPNLGNFVLRSELALVATSGLYNDLLAKPALAAVATSGLFSDLLGAPDLSGFVAFGDLASVAVSGDYKDLSNRPIGALAAGKWCMSDGEGVNCITDTPVLEEVDPTVNELARAELACSADQVAMYGEGWACASIEDAFDAYDDLQGDGHLDFTEGSDLVTKDQADANYIEQSYLETILERLNNLEAVWLKNNRMWQKEPPLNEMDWTVATDYCDDLELGGYTDWRMPTIDNLRELNSCGTTSTLGACDVKDGCTASACRNGSCNGCAYIRPNCYWDEMLLGGCIGVTWSSNGMDDNPASKWYLDFGTGNINSQTDTATGHVRCVR